MLPDSGRYALRARYVFPVVGDVLEDGMVAVAGGRVVAVGRDLQAADVIDLGCVALLPGFVNPHTHLDFSLLTEPLGERGMIFPQWIRRVIDWRQAHATGPEALRAGWQESLRQGVTTLGEIASPDRWTADLAPPQDVTVFHEVIAPNVDRAIDAIRGLENFLDQHHEPGRWRAGVSPHAPYTVLPGVFAATIRLAEHRQVPVAFHLAESREEIELLRDGQGAFRQLFDDLNLTNLRQAIPRGTRPLDYLQPLAEAPRALVIHGNYLSADEIAFVANHRQRMTVVYCPRTHAYFQHAPHPLRALLAAGAMVAIGTDSRASNPDLSMLAELRFVAHRYPELQPRTVLALGTIAAARALGRHDDAGSLEPGKPADLAVVRLPGRSAADPYDLLFDSELPVVATIVRGQLVWCES